MMRCWAWITLALCLSADTPLENLARVVRDKPSDASRDALARFAATEARTRDGALALLAVAVSELTEGRLDQAVTHLEEVRTRLPQLADYIGFWLAQARFQRSEYGSVAAALDPLWRQQPSSPLYERAALLLARAHLQNNSPRDVLAVLSVAGNRIQDPEGDLLAARAREALGEPAAAVTLYQRVWFREPLSKEAEDAGAALERLKASIGSSYPQPSGQQMLTRAARLLDAGQHARARREFEQMLPSLKGKEAEIARLRMAVAASRLNGRDSLDVLKDMDLKTPEADAERLYQVVSAARRLDRTEEFGWALDALATRHTKSTWRADALLAAANEYLLINDADAYTPLYQTCAEAFPKDTRAEFCHWKVVWSTYVRRSPDRTRLMREHLQKYPESQKSAAALYYLGRLSEESEDPGSAKAFYAELRRRFPNSYYALVPGREASERAAVRSATEPAEVKVFLGSLRGASRKLPEWELSESVQRRLERHRMLASIALYEWAEGELRYALKTEGQHYAMAMEASRVAARRGAPDKSIRFIKSFAPGYLYLPFDAAPREFWTLAFPLPYREPLERYSRANGLDPFLVAALIRQESEFNVEAVSRVSARGLTQVMPRTGAQLARQLGVRPYRTALLFHPDVNLRIGTHYLRTQLDKHAGKWELTLAAYNGGPTRVDRWRTWGDFREPSEFIETIPFTETREYVQIVLRNAEIYRRLYSGSPSAASAAPPNIRVHNTAAAKPKRASGAIQRKQNRPQKAKSGS